MRRIFSLLGILFLLAGKAGALTIQLDYSYDNGYFAGNAAAKAALEQAAADLSAALTFSLTAATDAYSGTNGPATVNIEWDLLTKNPSDLNAPNEVIPTFSIPEGIFRIYVGATTGLPGGGDTLGLGAPVSKQFVIAAEAGVGTDAQYEAALQNAVSFSNAALSRGSGPRETIITSDTDFGAPPNNVTFYFGPVAGFLTFDTAETWHFDHTTAVGGTEFDFYTVMLHEMMHCLGLGNSSTWTGLISNGTDWTGAHVISLVGSGTGIIHQFYNNDSSKPDGNHIAIGEMSTTVVGGMSQEAVMTPSLAKGERRKLTLLDVAFLQDIGYDNFAPLPTPTPAPTATPATATPTPAPAPPSAPVVSGPKKITTSQSKVKISGFLTAAGAHVEFAVGTKGKFAKAQGTGKWSVTAKVLPGKNLILLVAVDPTTGLKSAVVKVTVTRK